MNTIQKNNLALAAINQLLLKFNLLPEDYIKDYDGSITKSVALSTDTFEDKDKFIRDLKILANEYYRRVKNKHK